MTTTNTQIPSVLQRIVATKVEEVKAAREALSLEDLKAKVDAETSRVEALQPRYEPCLRRRYWYHC